MVFYHYYPLTDFPVVQPDCGRPLRPPPTGEAASSTSDAAATSSGGGGGSSSPLAPGPRAADGHPVPVGPAHGEEGPRAGLPEDGPPPRGPPAHGGGGADDGAGRGGPGVGVGAGTGPVGGAEQPGKRKV